jgi:hypothetical protein
MLILCQPDKVKWYPDSWEKIIDDYVYRRSFEKRLTFKPNSGQRPLSPGGLSWIEGKVRGSINSLVLRWHIHHHLS